MKTKENVIFRKGEKVDLCPLEKAHIPLLVKWFNDEKITLFMNRRFPMTVAYEETWLAGVYKDNKNYPFMITTKEGEPIGVVGLHNVNWINRTATNGISIG